jgi:hypothetical protein
MMRDVPIFLACCAVIYALANVPATTSGEAAMPPAAQVDSPPQAQADDETADSPSSPPVPSFENTSCASGQCGLPSTSVYKGPYTGAGRTGPVRRILRPLSAVRGLLGRLRP